MWELFIGTPVPLLCLDQTTCIEVAVGKPSTPTPNGEFVLSPMRTASGKLWVSIGTLHSQLGIHPYPAWKSGYLSHGCVRVRDLDIDWVWAQVFAGNNQLKISDTNPPPGK